MIETTLDVSAMALFSLGYALFVEGVRLWWRAHELAELAAGAMSAAGLAAPLP